MTTHTSNVETEAAIARCSDWCTQITSVSKRERIERLCGEKNNLMLKVQEAWFEYRAVEKSKEKELPMEPGFLTSLWPRKTDDLSECPRGSNHQGLCETYPMGSS